MATISFKSGDEWARKLADYGAGSDEIIKKAIYVGAGILADAVGGRLRAVLAGSRTSTGDLAASLGVTRIRQDSRGVWNAKVGFSGRDRKGTPNQLKARVLESGSSKQKKRPFCRPAVAAVKQEVLDAMGKVIDEETEKFMKG